MIRFTAVARLWHNANVIIRERTFPCYSGHSKYTTVATTRFLSLYRRKHGYLTGKRNGFINNLQTLKLFNSCHTQNKIRQCWNCNTDLQMADLFCHSCSKLNTLDESLSYFQIFDLPKKFNINLLELSKKFKNLQVKLHPDKFTLKSEKEQIIANNYSSAVNNAYNILTHPLKRGLYMLEMHNTSLAEGEISMDNLFLMEIMEINESIADATDVAVVQKIGDENKIVMIDLFLRLENAFDENQIKLAKSLIAELKYYTNIDDKVKEFEQSRGIYHN